MITVENNIVSIEHDTFLRYALLSDSLGFKNGIELILFKDRKFFSGKANQNFLPLGHAIVIDQLVKESVEYDSIEYSGKYMNVLVNAEKRLGLKMNSFENVSSYSLCFGDEVLSLDLSHTDRKLKEYYDSNIGIVFNSIYYSK